MDLWWGWLPCQTTHYSLQLHLGAKKRVLVKEMQMFSTNYYNAIVTNEPTNCITVTLSILRACFHAQNLHKPIGIRQCVHISIFLRGQTDRETQTEKHLLNPAVRMFTSWGKKPVTIIVGNCVAPSRHLI